MSIVFLTQTAVPNIALLMKKLIQVVEYFYATLYLSNFKRIISLAAKYKVSWHLVEMEGSETCSDAAHLLLKISLHSANHRVSYRCGITAGRIIKTEIKLLNEITLHGYKRQYQDPHGCWKILVLGVGYFSNSC